MLPLLKKARVGSYHPRAHYSTVLSTVTLNLLAAVIGARLGHTSPQLVCVRLCLTIEQQAMILAA